MKHYDKNVTWKALIGDVERVVFRRIRKARPVPYSDLLRLPYNPKIPAVYVICNSTGEHLYAGATQDLRGRLQQHLDRNLRNSLSSRIVEEEMLSDEGRKRLASRIRKEFKVIVLDATDGFDYSPRGMLEKLVQWVLEPKYGYWPSPGRRVAGCRSARA